MGRIYRKCHIFALNVTVLMYLNENAETDQPVIICLDLRAPLQTIDAGPAAPTFQLGADIWCQLAMAALGDPVGTPAVGSITLGWSVK